MINANKLIQANNLCENPELIPKKVSFVMRKINTPRGRKDGKSKFIEELTKSNDHLVKNLDNLRSNTNCLKDLEQYKHVMSLVNKLDNLDDEVKTEKSYLEDLEEQIHKMDVKQKKLARTYGGNCQADTVDSKAIAKSRERLQEKLHVETVHLGEEITKNHELKEKISCMMSERSRFNKEYNDILGKLKSGKIIMQDVVESVNMAEGKRTNMATKIEKINTQEQKQIALLKEEACNLNMHRDYEFELSKFNLNKTKERESATSSEKEKQKSRQLSDQSILEKSERLLLNIFQRAGEELGGLDGVLCRLQKNQSEIMSLVTYATHLNHEMEVLKDKLVDQGKRIDDISAEQDKESFWHEDGLRHLNGIKEELEERQLNSADDISATGRLLSRLFEGIEHLTKTTKADVSPLLQLLGENDKVTVFNYKLYMESLETKLIEIMSMISLSSIVLTPVGAMKGPPVLKGKHRSTVLEESNRRTVSVANRPTVLLEDSQVVLTIPCQECTTSAKKEV